MHITTTADIETLLNKRRPAELPIVATMEKSGKVRITGKDLGALDCDDVSYCYDVTGLWEWLERRPVIQTALPQSTNTEREFLISGIGPVGWARTFPYSEDEE